MEICLPEKVKYILNRLESQGYQAYAVGGCVRDSVLGKTPSDWDITTSARPLEVKRLFSRTIDTGIQHGTVTVMLGRDGFEVTTFRIDGVYEDARHPKNVIFTPDLSEDLRRRDFTINAMAYSDREGFVDLFGGMDDLKRRVIRCVGDPLERFDEDALRMMRAVRFSAQLGFGIEENTFAAIRQMADQIGKVSAERIQTELVKLLVSDHPEQMRDLYRSGIADVILPEFSEMMQTPQHNVHHKYSVGEHTIHALMRIRPDRVTRLTMLFHDVAKPVCRTTDADGVDHFKGHPARGAEMTRRIMRRLKFDNDTIRRVCALVALHDDRPPLRKDLIRREISRYGRECFPDLFAVKRADILAQSAYHQREKLRHISGHERLWREIISSGDCLSIHELAVSGSDLLACGIPQGRQIGQILQKMLEEVLVYPEKNQKEILLNKYVRK